MAQADVLKGTALYIKVGDGADPEVFTHPCMINAKRGIQFQSNTNKPIIPDCDNPDDAAWTQCIKDGLSAIISGAGKIDNKLATIQMYDAWYRGDDAKNVQVWLGAVGKFAGAFKLTGWEISGDRGDYCDVTVTFESHGALEAFAE